jgi:hypothetical protein
MRYRTDQDSLDHLTTPIILCDKEGRVIYKNDIAVSQIRLPKRNTDMRVHLDQTGTGELDRIFERKRPSLITVHTGDRNAKAFVTSYYRNEQECSLWVFSSFMQTNASSRLFSTFEAEMTAVAKDLCDIIIAIDQKSLLPLGKSANSLNKKIETKFTHLLSSLLEGRTENSTWSVKESIQILSTQIPTLFGEFGYHIQMNVMDSSKNISQYLDFRNFILFYSHALTFCAELTRNRKLHLNIIGTDEMVILFEIQFTLLYPPIFSEESSDLSQLYQLAPMNCFDILIFDALTKLSGYHISYSVNSSHEDNVVIRFKIPTTLKRSLYSSKNLGKENAFVKTDADTLLGFVLGYANFTPENQTNETNSLLGVSSENIRPSDNE